MEYQYERLLNLIALCGEYPRKNLGRVSTEAYANLMIKKLLNQGLIESNPNDPKFDEKLFSYRLTSQGKKYLLEKNPQRYKKLFTGQLDTNRKAKTPSVRSRLHRIAEAVTMIENTGIEINPEATSNIRFIFSRELKSSATIKGSSLIGLITTPTDKFSIYNTSDKTSNWRLSTEQRARAIFQTTLPKVQGLGAILIGANLETLHKNLTTTNPKQNLKRFIAIYEQMYFVTNDILGEMQIKLLSNAEKQKELFTKLLKPYKPKIVNYPMVSDGMTENENPILNCCLMDIQKLVKFESGLVTYKKKGMIICFDFQKQFIEGLLGECVEFATVKSKTIKTWLA